MTKTLTIRITSDTDIAHLTLLQALTGEPAASKALLTAARTWPALREQIADLKQQNQRLHHQLTDLADAWKQYQDNKTTLARLLDDLPPALHQVHTEPNHE